MPHTLLLADDSVTTQRVIEITFAGEDIAVIVAGDGNDALARVESERPDIVLADIGLPGRNGYELAAYIKGQSQLAHIPVVLLADALDPLDEERARAAGCDGVFVKPFEPQMVIDRVKALLSSRHAPAAGDDPPLARAPQPQSGPDASAPVLDPLEAYFDRLDSAFAAIASGPGMHRPSAAPSPSDEALTSRPPDLAEESGPARDPLAGAFAALLAAEQGLVPPQALALAPPAAPVSDEVIDQIVSRVLARMGDESIRQLVSETAERLVRQEIDRIKAAARSGGTQTAG